MGAEYTARPRPPQGGGPAGELLGVDELEAVEAQRDVLGGAAAGEGLGPEQVPAGGLIAAGSMPSMSTTQRTSASGVASSFFSSLLAAVLTPASPSSRWPATTPG